MEEYTPIPKCRYNHPSGKLGGPVLDTLRFDGREYCEEQFSCRQISSNECAYCLRTVNTTRFSMVTFVMSEPAGVTFRATKFRTVADAAVAVGVKGGDTMTI